MYEHTHTYIYSCSSFDRYGFSQGTTADSELENPLKQRVRKLDQQAQQAYDVSSTCTFVYLFAQQLSSSLCLQETIASQKARWDNFMASCGGGREMQRNVGSRQTVSQCCTHGDRDVAIYVQYIYSAPLNPLLVIRSISMKQEPRTKYNA